MTNSVNINIKECLCDYLERYHQGAEKAISSKELENIFGIRGRLIRKEVNSLRCEGKPLCSDAMGYFYGRTSHELSATISQLDSRIYRISQARDGLNNYLNTMKGGGDKYDCPQSNQ